MQAALKKDEQPYSLPLSLFAWFSEPVEVADTQKGCDRSVDLSLTAPMDAQGLVQVSCEDREMGDVMASGRVPSLSWSNSLDFQQRAKITLQ